LSNTTGAEIVILNVVKDIGKIQPTTISANQVLSMASNIVTLAFINHAYSLQALLLINDCYKYQMDLTTNGVVITDALRYVQGKMEHLNKTEKALLQDIKEDREKLEEEEDIES
jgi:hypothetical protein